MKLSKKIIALAAVAAMTITAIPVSQNLSEVKAAAFTAVAKYDFENGTGMKSSGISGTAPTVAADAERGNVLKFADGTGSEIVTAAKDTSLEEHSYRIAVGSPSSLKFDNPFKGKSLSGVTIAYWIKVPSEVAAGVSDDGEVDESFNLASGIVGFVDDKERTLQHPDCAVGGHSDQFYTGRSFLGITAQPNVYFNQIHHNSITVLDTDATIAYKPNVWQYCAVSISNEDVKLYVDGVLLKKTETTKGKRFLNSDEYENPGNEGMPFLMDFLSDNMSYTFGGKKGTTTLTDATSGKSVTYGKIESNIQGYVGFTGFSKTYAGVCIDDLAFFTKAYGESDMAALYEAAKTADGITVSAGASSGSASSGGSASGSSSVASGSSKGSAVSQEVAAAISASTKLVSAPEGVAIGTPVAILKGDAALGSTYDAVKECLDSGVAPIIAENPDWTGLSMSNNIFIQDIPVTGRQLAEGEKAVIEMNVPDGFDTNMIWVLRVDPDGKVTKCVITSIADGKIQFETDSIAKFAIVQMTYGNKLPQTGVVSTGIFVAFGASALAGGACLLKKKKED